MVLSKKGDILHFLVLLSHVDRIFFFTFSEIKGFFFFFPSSFFMLFIFLHALYITAYITQCLLSGVETVLHLLQWFLEPIFRGSYLLPSS